jgi:predicted RecB family endonuclease
MHGLPSTCLQNSHAIAITQLSFSDMKSRKKEIEDLENIEDIARACGRRGRGSLGKKLRKIIRKFAFLLCQPGGPSAEYGRCKEAGHDRPANTALSSPPEQERKPHAQTSVQHG